MSDFHTGANISQSQSQAGGWEGKLGYSGGKLSQMKRLVLKHCKSEPQSCITLQSKVNKYNLIKIYKGIRYLPKISY